MVTIVHRWVAECRSGTHPRAIARLASGWLILGDVQFLPGYSLLLPDPVVPDLNQVTGAARTTLLADMVAVGDALLAVTQAKRINYEILGNLEPALHIHLFPRFDHEPAALKTRPAWFYDWDQAPRFDLQRDLPLMKKIHAYLDKNGLVVD